MELVKWLLEKSPNALRLAKRLINAGAERSVNAVMARETLASVEATPERGRPRSCGCPL
jgi:enoyl-CoA hydratase/carnithine racemase